MQRLAREGWVLGELDHPNVLKLVEERLDHHPPYLVFEFLPGGSLGSLLERTGPLPLEMALVVLRQIASALSKFHARGGFHRDVKPDNILIAADGTYVLADANLAGIPSERGSLTRTTCGTPGYIDPSVVNREYDWRADIWSLGVTFAQVVTHCRPDEIASSHGELAVDPQKIRAPNDSSRKLVMRLLTAMMSQDRELRPSAAVVQQYADVLLGGGQLPALPSPERVAEAPTLQPQVVAGMAMAALFALVAIGIGALLVAAARRAGPGGPAS